MVRSSYRSKSAQCAFERILHWSLMVAPLINGHPHKNYLHGAQSVYLLHAFFFAFLVHSTVHFCVHIHKSSWQNLWLELGSLEFIPSHQGILSLPSSSTSRLLDYFLASLFFALFHLSLHGLHICQQLAASTLSTPPPLPQCTTVDEVLDQLPCFPILPLLIGL